MNAGIRLLRLRGGGACLRHVRIGMRHRAELRNDQRQGGDDREAQLQTMLQSWQGLNLKDDEGMLALRAPIRNCFTQICARRVTFGDAAQRGGQRMRCAAILISVRSRVVTSISARPSLISVHGSGKLSGTTEIT
jgi:hypothetical protein